MEHTQESGDNERLAAALEYAGRGWKIFPCKGKKPWIDDWENEASDNLLQIQAWWARWPDANLALPVAANGYVVVDVDPAHGGSESLRLLEEQGFSAQTGLVAKTGTGGLHLFFKHPANGEKVKTRAPGPADGLDIRADGGYVVLAPSIHPVSGEAYSWLREGDAAEMPAWINLTQRGAPRPGTSREQHPNGSGPQREGGRNHALTREAGSLRARGYSGQALAIALNAFNQDHCDPPLTTEEVNQIAASVARYDRGQREPYTHDDTGNADRLLDRYGDELRHVKLWNKWLQWNGRYWERDRDHAVIEMAKEITKEIAAEAMVVEDDQHRARMLKFATSSRNTGRLKSMRENAESSQRVSLIPDDLDRDTHLLNLMNGTLDLKTGQLQEHNKDDLITRGVGISWDSHAHCPLWIGFLNRVFGGDQELISYVKRLVGYCLTGETIEQKFFFLYGTGANGKSTFLDTVKKVLGSYSQTVQAKTFSVQQSEGISNDIAGLVGARLISSPELEPGMRLATGRVKEFTGGDLITARFMHQEFFTFRPVGKVLMIGNHRPEIRNFDEGLWRRLRLVPFEVTIASEERDPRMTQKLEGELPGILRWAVEGCLEWKERGLDEPLAVMNATQSYRADMDIIGELLEMRTQIDIKGNAQSTALYQAYTAFCETRGERPMSQKAFGMALLERKLPITKVRTKHGWVYQGIKLVDANVSNAEVEM